MFFGVFPLYTWLDLLSWCEASVIGCITQSCHGLNELIDHSASIWISLFELHFAHRPVQNDARLLRRDFIRYYCFRFTDVCALMSSSLVHGGMVVEERISWDGARRLLTCADEHSSNLQFRRAVSVTAMNDPRRSYRFLFTIRSFCRHEISPFNIGIIDVAARPQFYHLGGKISFVGPINSPTEWGFAGSNAAHRDTIAFVLMKTPQSVARVGSTVDMRVCGDTVSLYLHNADGKKPCEHLFSRNLGTLTTSKTWRVAVRLHCCNDVLEIRTARPVEG